jgi:hypothetical protein
MSEQSNETQESRAPARSLWSAFNGAEVVLQLREPYQTVTHPNLPLFTVTLVSATGTVVRSGFVSGNQLDRLEAELAADLERKRRSLAPGEQLPPEEQLHLKTEPALVGSLIGTLRVWQDTSGTMLEVETRDPLDAQAAAGGPPLNLCRILVAPDLVGFLTVVQRRLIQT